MNLLDATRAIFASSLPPNDKLVALALLNHWSRARDTFPGVGRLVAWTSLSRRSVLRSIGHLETTGAVKVDRKAGLANRYDLTPLEALTSATGAPVPDGHQCQSDTPPVPQGHGTSATQAPEVIQVSDPLKGSKPRRSAPALKSAGKAKGPKKARPEARWPAAHPELLRRYVETYTRIRGRAPYITSRDAKAANDLLDATKGNVDEAASLLDNGLTNWDQATLVTVAGNPSSAQTKRVANGFNRTPQPKQPNSGWKPPMQE